MYAINNYYVVIYLMAHFVIQLIIKVIEDLAICLCASDRERDRESSDANAREPVSSLANTFVE